MITVRSTILGAVILLGAAGAWAAGALPLVQWERHVIDANRPWRAVFIAAADIDGDRLADLVTGGWWYRNPGAPGGAWQRHEIGAPLCNMAAVYDFDGDGDMDILGTKGKGSDPSAEFVWAMNRGKTLLRDRFRIFDNIPKAQGDFLQGAAALDGRKGRRGTLEIALSWHQPGQGVQLLSVPADPTEGRWGWRKISNTSQNEALSAGDIDKDGDGDLLLGTRWLRNSGGPDWALYRLSDVEGDPDRNRLADINDDGRADAVVGFEAISVPGKLAWYEQPDPATETWTEHVIARVVGPMSLSVADMDRDGDQDVVVGEHNLKAPATARQLVFENADGKGGQWLEHVVHTGDEHHDGSITVDIDNDGDLDIASIGWEHSNVVLYENKAISKEARKPAAEPEKKE